MVNDEVEGMPEAVSDHGAGRGSNDEPTVLGSVGLLHVLYHLAVMCGKIPYDGTRHLAGGGFKNGGRFHFSGYFRA